MALVEVHWNPTSRQLRQFSAICLVAPAALTWLATHSSSATTIVGAIGVVVAATGWLFPPIIRPLFVALSVLTAPLGMVMGEITLLIVYLGVVTPIGWTLRVLRGDPLAKRPDRDAISYWESRSSPKDVRQYYHQH